VAALNGPSARRTRIDLAFLTAGRYDALVVKDDPGDSAAVRVEKTTVANGAAMRVDLRDGGGFIMRLRSTSNVPSNEYRVPSNDSR